MHRRRPSLWSIWAGGGRLQSHGKLGPRWEASGLTYFIASGLEWVPDDVIDGVTFTESPHKVFFEKQVPGHLRGIVDYRARRESERILELCRVQGFLDRPSRARAIFLNLTREDAERWISKETRAGYHIYEVEADHTESVAEANYIWFNYLVRLCRDFRRETRGLFSDDLSGEIEQVARSYWENVATDDFGAASRIEVLFIGSLRVLRRIA